MEVLCGSLNRLLGTVFDKLISASADEKFPAIYRNLWKMMSLILVLGLLDKVHTQSHCISVKSTSVSSSPILLNLPRSPSTLVFGPKFYTRSQIAKTDYQLHVRLSIHLPGATRLPLDWFPWNFIFEYFSKTCRENSSFVKLWQE
jgi:hypothetical protein